MGYYFIHTMELRKMISFEEYTVLKENIDFFPDSKAGELELYPLTSTQYKKNGLTLTIRDTNEKEKLRCTGGKHHLLIINVNPSRLIYEGTYYNLIKNYEQFKIAVDYLCIWLEAMFGELTEDSGDIDTYTLRRIDITKDISDVPENIVKQFILLMRRMPLGRGFFLNKELEERCIGFRKEDSFNALNASQGIEFVLYNKHKAALDQNYPDKDREQYKNVLRMELRCGRKFIRRLTGKIGTKKAIKQIYKQANEIVDSAYRAMLKHYNGCCFISGYFTLKLIEKSNAGEKKKIKMLSLVKGSNTYKDMDIDGCGQAVFGNNEKYKKVQGYFEKLSISPVTPDDTTIPFIQSPNSLLEFEVLTEQEERLFIYLQKKTRGKEVFLHAE